MTHYESPEKAPQAVSRLGLYLPTGLLLLLALGWSGFWYFAAQKADAALVSWMTLERSSGRNWDCAGQKISGYPFRIELHCASIKFSGPQITAELGSFHAATQIYSPKLILADLSGPLKINSGGLPNVFTWNNLRVSLRFGSVLERFSMNVSDLKAGETGDAIAMTAKEMELHLRSDTERAFNDKAIDVVLNFNELRANMLDGMIGNAEITSINLVGAVTQTQTLRAGTWQSLLETWRVQNGQFFLDNGRFVKGNFLIEAKGSLSLDPARRLQGDLIAGARGIGPLIGRFVPGNAAQLATALLDRKDGSILPLPLRLQDGRLSFGPLRTGPILPPLY